MLAIDCGNTRIKWARFGPGAPPAPATPKAAGATGALVDPAAHGSAALGDGDAAFAALAATLAPDPGRVLVANVAGDAAGTRIAATVKAALRREPEFVAVEAKGFGIECAYAEPARLGVDRWLAMIAARRRSDGAFAVVCAGTAVTFDAVDAAGRHLGGLILPGDGLMRDALAARTGRIGRVESVLEPVAGIGLLGRSTAEAVGHGARLAIAAAVDRAWAVVARALAETPRLIVTGGEAGTLAGWLETKAEVSADLVLEGLAVIAESEDR